VKRREWRYRLLGFAIGALMVLYAMHLASLAGTL
jgi:hypothetical protein